jgi:hypothetical protein
MPALVTVGLLRYRAVRDDAAQFVVVRTAATPREVLEAMLAR